MIDTASDRGEEQIDTTSRHPMMPKKPVIFQDVVDPEPWELKMKNEQSLESLHDHVKAEANDDSSDSEWEEVETKIVAVDCSCVHTLFVNAYKDTQTAAKPQDKKAYSTQTFVNGQPPIMSLN